MMDLASLLRKDDGINSANSETKSAEWLSTYKEEEEFNNEPNLRAGQVSKDLMSNRNYSNPEQNSSISASQTGCKEAVDNYVPFHNKYRVVYVQG